MTTLTGNLAAPARQLAEAEDVRPTRRREGPLGGPPGTSSTWSPGWSCSRWSSRFRSG